MFVRVRQDKIAWKDRRIRFLELETETTTRGFIPLDSRHYSESASGTAAREHCYIVLRAAVKAETRKDDEEEEEEAGETATAFHHTASLPDPSFFPLLS